MQRKTPLYDLHAAAGGKMVPFAGYLLPVQYKTGVVREHMAVRQQAGLFDVSHMGEIVLSGPTALASLNHLLTNDFTNLAAGRVRYSVMCNERGGCVDDLVVYYFGSDKYLLVVNAANREKDFAHIRANLLPGTEAEDLSDSIAQLALQGPEAPAILADVLPEELIPKKYYSAVKEAVIDGMTCMISRTGYTGELGYELYTAAENAPRLWEVLMAAGAERGLIPCGLGARDTLRLEAAMPLYGHEMDEDTSPLAAGLDFAVKLNKAEFIGREALIAAGAPERVRVGLVVTGRGIIREHQTVYLDGEPVGVTTSGTHCPYLGRSAAMAYLPAELAEVGKAVDVDVRGRMVRAEIVPLPFYRRSPSK